MRGLSANFPACGQQTFAAIFELPNRSSKQMATVLPGLSLLSQGNCTLRYALDCTCHWFPDRIGDPTECAQDRIVCIAKPFDVAATCGL